ncbi:DJ-1 family protein [Halorhodospira abdelmalekii]|uniref:DJ-1 family glyoxalase III n=1 Tax=Halorhodospira abdelmalekii TaxID=421629 RepID=UPI001902D32A|nr:DJ-1 family glyoxalase III [Halorhodospira abdelmalekii]MBK1733704.1 DJ-1 family protein [Halorhodospira abdelmalekii]
MRALVLCAEGSEELELVTIVDLLRRATIDTVVAGLAAGPVRCSRGMVFEPETTLDTVLTEAFDLIVLPGGLGGTERFESDERVLQLLQQQDERGAWIAAICAAPRVLVAAGLHKGRRLTAYPTQLEAKGVEPVAESVVVDRNVITSRGPGTAMDFGLVLIEELLGQDQAAEVEQALQRPLAQQRYG